VAGAARTADAVAPERADDCPKRADARRNRDLLLATAAAVFEERGIEAPLQEIARRAGVGIGTLYRHFPTRDALNEAVYRREVDMLCDGVADLLRENSPVDALAQWMRAFAGYVARKRGMATALKSALGPDNELFSHSHRRIREALETLVAAARDSGEIRADVELDDLMRAMSGICMAGDASGSRTDRTARIVGLLIDGLRYGAPSPA